MALQTLRENDDFDVMIITLLAKIKRLEDEVKQLAMLRRTGIGGGMTKTFANNAYLRLDGSRAMTGNLNMNTHKILFDTMLLKRYVYGVGVRNLADTTWQNFYANRFQGTFFTLLSTYLSLQTGANDTDHFYIITGAGSDTILDSYAGKCLLPNLPVADPHVAGELWNNGGVVTVSAG